jgi:hypothetical protein
LIELVLLPWHILAIILNAIFRFESERLVDIGDRLPI